MNRSGRSFVGGGKGFVGGGRTPGEEVFSPPRRQERQVRQMANRDIREWKWISRTPISRFLGALGVLAVQIHPIRADFFTGLSPGAAALAGEVVSAGKRPGMGEDWSLVWARETVVPEELGWPKKGDLAGWSSKKCGTGVTCFPRAMGIPPILRIFCLASTTYGRNIQIVAYGRAAGRERLA